MKTKDPKQKQTKKKFLSILIGIILLMSVIGFILPIYGPNNSDNQNIQNTIKYNNKEFFLLQDGRYATQIGQGNIVINNNPLELSSITIPYYPITSNKVYLAYNPDKAENIDFIIQKFNNIILLTNSRPVNACIIDNEDCPDIPIISCNDNEQTIKILKSNKNSIYQDKNCLVFEGDISYLDKASDKFLLNILGI